MSINFEEMPTQGDARFAAGETQEAVTLDQARKTLAEARQMSNDVLVSRGASGYLENITDSRGHSVIFGVVNGHRIRLSGSNGRYEGQADNESLNSEEAAKFMQLYGAATIPR